MLNAELPLAYTLAEGGGADRHGTEGGAGEWDVWPAGMGEETADTFGESSSEGGPAGGKQHTTGTYSHLHPDGDGGGGSGGGVGNGRVGGVGVYEIHLWAMID